MMSLHRVLPSHPVYIIVTLVFVTILCDRNLLHPSRVMSRSIKVNTSIMSHKLDKLAVVVVESVFPCLIS